MNNPFNGSHPASYHTLWGDKRRAKNAAQIADLELKQKLADPTFRKAWMEANFTTKNPAQKGS